MKKIKDMFYKPKMAIFFYVLAVILFGYTIYTGYVSYQYIAGLVSQGSITWLNSLSDIIGYFISNSSTYLFYGLAFTFFGYACNYLNPKLEKEVELIEEQIEEEIIVDNEILEG